jgi:uncharacterized protein YqgC (DUF456 family)
MDWLLITLAIILSFTGIFGCIIPGLPGHPLNYLAMWCIQWSMHSFETSSLIIFGILTVIVLILDYMVPIWTAKKYGATKQGIWGSIIGMIVGMFLGPLGMIIGTIAGAIIGDMMAGRSTSQATRSGMATFTGTLISIGLKLLLAGVMTSMVFYKIIDSWIK